MPLHRNGTATKGRIAAATAAVTAAVAAAATGHVAGGSVARPSGADARHGRQPLPATLLLGIPALVFASLFVVDLDHYWSGATAGGLSWDSLKVISNHGVSVLFDVRRALRALDFMLVPLIGYISYMWRRHQSNVVIDRMQFRSLVKFELIDDVPCTATTLAGRRLGLTALFQRTLSRAMFDNDQLIMLLRDACKLTTVENPFVQCENKKHTYLITNALTMHFLEVLNVPSVLHHSFSQPTRAECFVFALTNLQKSTVQVFKIRVYVVKESTLRAVKSGALKLSCSDRTTFRGAHDLLQKMAAVYEPPVGVDMSRKDLISPHQYKVPPGFGRFWLNTPAAV
jgi:hypothetical protein